MQISPVSHAQNAFNTIINPQQPADTNPITTAKAADQVSISSAAKALASGEATESPSTESSESSAAQKTEGEASSGKSINITA
ncbi:MAG: hypothetical protein Q9M14_01620 [Mariprofundaceae bacterium]|nr:hypothetical protein [Mariprofundaceae bacterium]